MLAFGCSSARYSTEPGAPSLVMPARFGEGKGEAKAAPSASAAPPLTSAYAAPDGSGAPASGSAPAALTPSTAPDPTPLRQAEQVEYELELSEGKVRVISVKAVTLPAPIVTPRRLGRYALELSIGKELIERVRFDFPGTAADDPQVGPKKPLFSPLTLSERAIARVKLLVPHSARVRRAALVNRALSTATELEWPMPSVPKALPAPSGAAAQSGAVAASSSSAPSATLAAGSSSAPSGSAGASRSSAPSGSAAASRSSAPSSSAGGPRSGAPQP